MPPSHLCVHGKDAVHDFECASIVILVLFSFLLWLREGLEVMEQSPENCGSISLEPALEFFSYSLEFILAISS